MPSRITIENTDRFCLISIDNGAAYEMTDKRSGVAGETRFVQYGDDATNFRAAYDGMSEAHGKPDSVWHARPWNACLAYLFFDCMAASEES